MVLFRNAKHEITRKFDEIVAFSGVERYIDTPVKRYSSGMYVRLAFAVAAHLESEVLIVDEVLAVGDADFQRKCLGKMNEVSKGEGRTVLFVSHNMAAVKSLCTKGIVLENGLLAFNGNADQAVRFYLNEGGSETSNIYFYDQSLETSVFKLNSIAIKNGSRSLEDPILENETITLITDIDFKAGAERYSITYHLYNELGEALFSLYDSDSVTNMKEGNNKLVCEIPANFFQSGNFALSLFIVEDKRVAIHIERDIFRFTVIDGGRDLGTYMGREPGYIRPQFKWSRV